MNDQEVKMPMKEAMNNLALALDQILNGQAIGGRQSGFVLLLFPYDDKSGNCNYVSNGANREDIVRMFKAQVKLLEEQFEMNGKEQ